MIRSWKQEALKCALQWLPLISAASACDDASDGNMDKESVAQDAASALYDDGADGDEEEEADAAVGADGDDGALVGDTYALTSHGRLLFFARSSGELVRSLPLSGVPEGETLLGADIRPADGALYALTSAAKLYTVDVASGAAQLAANLAADAADTSAPFAGLSGSKFGIDFNPVPDRLRIVSDQGQNLRINVDTGAVTSDGVLSPQTPGVVAAAYTNSFASACRTRLYVVDAANGALLLQDPPNDGTLGVVGPLGVATDALTSFEIVSARDGAQHALIALSDASGSQLLDVDLSSGQASNPRSLALEPGETVLALAAPPPASPPAQALGEMLGLAETGTLVSFNRGAPGKPCSAVQLAGLATGESALGMDVRPADGALYLLGSGGTLYTVDPSTGAATVKATLFADSADTSDPYDGLDGGALGMGFNPVSDRLRVITSAGHNLRIDVDSGATSTDTALSHGTVAGVAYTNARAGADSTTLYALDASADALVRIGGDPASSGACPGDQGNPNCGQLTSLGALAVGGDVTDSIGFDIDAASGSAFAALSLADDPSSSLYLIDLATGSASLPPGSGTIGGGARLRGLTFAE